MVVEERAVAESLYLLGVNHRTLPVAGRERLARAFPEQGSAAAELRESCGFSETVVLSTCNRFEIVGVGGNAALSGAEARLQTALGPEFNPKVLYRYAGSDAVTHLFRVASGIDSMVIGEPQITGQVKDAYREAVRERTVGALLHRLFQSAFKTAKKVRQYTAVGEGGVSVSYVAVELARQIFGNLSEVSVLVLGSGEMAELTVLHLKRQGCRNLSILNRTAQRASDLASRFGAAALPLSEFERVLGGADIVIGSLRIDRPILPVAAVKQMAREKPLFLIDLGVPRNFAPALGDLEAVYLYTIDDLAQVAARNRELREESGHDAHLIVEYQRLCFEGWLQRYLVSPAQVVLRERIAEVCRQEVERAFSLEPAASLPRGGSNGSRTERLAHRIGAKVAHEILELLGTTPSLHREGSALDADDLAIFLRDRLPLTLSTTEKEGKND